MHIKNVLDLISIHYKENNLIDDNILKEMSAAIMELEAAESMFNFVNDSKLIDAAIYREEAAKKKIDYILSIAKQEYFNKENEPVKNEMEV